MTLLDESGRPSAVFLIILLSISFQGADCELLVSPIGPNRVNALTGSNVTLAVSFSGALHPVVTWIMGNVTVVTWTINSSTPPDIAESFKKVLRLEQNGSLSFVNVQLDCTNTYTIEMTKSGLSKAVTSFTLKVFESFQNVTLSTQPSFAQEGADWFILQYSMLQGVSEKQMWLFNGVEIKTNSRYLVEQRSLVIFRPNRSDTGQYTVLLTNPFSSVTTHIDVSVLYGPDEALLEAHPAHLFYISGDSLILSCHADSFPQPTAKWVFGGQTLNESHNGVLKLTNVRVNQGGIYTCTLLNMQTKVQKQKAITLNIYETPSGEPICSVESVFNASLQYHCQWPGGTPQAQLSFPALSNTNSGAGNFSLTVNASDKLNGKTVTCIADHPVTNNTCSITSSSPVAYLPAVITTVDSEGKTVVVIHCVSEASPQAVVSWTKGSEAITNGTAYQICSDTTQLQISDYNVSNFLLLNYTCTCSNPLGTQRREIQLLGPAISDSSLLPNKDRTIATLTWNIPPTSVVTGFDIQMMGPDLNKNHTGSRRRGSSNSYRTIQKKPGSARSADIFTLNPQKMYQFRVVPKAHMTEGEPSVVHRIGPDKWLSGPAIAGISAGIPCSLVILLLLGGLIYLRVYCKKKKSRQTRYPVSRAVDKAITTLHAQQSDTLPSHLQTGGLKSPPDYNRLHQTPPERSVDLPTFVPPPPPVRVATTV